jgi:hypothetical protein
VAAKSPSSARDDVELINTTAASASLTVTAVEGPEPHKAGRFLAKLTFKVLADVRVELRSDDASPILDADIETPTGALPSDVDTASHDAIELIVNGAAYSPRPTHETVVILALGDREHRISVTGDRSWVRTAGAVVPSEPVPFTRLPMTYERAFGGTVEVWLDPHTVIPVSHPANPLGRGLDPEPAVRMLAQELACSADFPRFDPVRQLPNLEDPRARITRWEDAPAPHCWSTRPRAGLGAVAIPHDFSSTPAEERTALLTRIQSATQIRSHPDLLLRGPVGGLPISLSGMTPTGAWRFRLPNASVTFDYDIDGRRGTLPAALRRIVLLPEEGSFSLLFERKFRFKSTPSGDRSIRVRVEDSV